MKDQNQNDQQLEVVKKDISAQVLAKVDTFQKSGELRIPKDYSPENALKSAYLILTDPRNNLLAKCTKESVANALLKMVVWGLSPLKKQCDFIPYGDKLECTPEYTGNIVLAKRYGNLKWIKANAIFENDEFVFQVDADTGCKRIVKHEQSLESIGSKNLKGAYAIYQLNDGTTDVEVMSMIQIRDAWNQGPMKGNSPAHKNFPDQMAMKTVINRACKMLVRSSDDSALYTGDENDDISPIEREINQNANAEDISFVDIVDENHETTEAPDQDPKQEPTTVPTDGKNEPDKPKENDHPKTGIQKTMPGF